MSEGAHSAVWSGDNNQGHPVASGLYFCIMRFEGQTETRKLVLLR
jgi:hypothetical protein